MVKAYWNDTLLAESNDTVMIEGNQYFPPKDVKKEYLVETAYRTTCPWKGEAHYHNVVIGDQINENAAWSYPRPKEKAVHIADHVAFWKGVYIEN